MRQALYRPSHMFADLQSMGAGRCSWFRPPSFNSTWTKEGNERCARQGERRGAGMGEEGTLGKSINHLTQKPNGSDWSRNLFFFLEIQVPKHTNKLPWRWQCSLKKQTFNFVLVKNIHIKQIFTVYIYIFFCILELEIKPSTSNVS